MVMMLMLIKMRKKCHDWKACYKRDNIIYVKEYIIHNLC